MFSRWLLDQMWLGIVCLAIRVFLTILPPVITVTVECRWASRTGCCLQVQTDGELSFAPQHCPLMAVLRMGLLYQQQKWRPGLLTGAAVSERSNRGILIPSDLKYSWSVSKINTEIKDTRIKYDAFITITYRLQLLKFKSTSKFMTMHGL